ncbi:DNA topoisomerase IB [Marinoscillum pacificum]|uniref:DNA topoisomerase IB n=1 Tax=Marinoscillum pacificum TaxID=392723 RepID=UPI0021589F6F|nr:hypothetical protein [Marinoscillum pacificum]
MYKRKRHGKGFTYQDDAGKTIQDKELRKWFESLVIPPAWSDVHIYEPKEKVLVTGRDEKGRKQYIYNPDYLEKQRSKKYNRIVRFAESLERMRRVTGQHMRASEMTRNKVCATMLRLMDQAFFRPGNPQYTKRNGTHGLTTLRSKHLEIEEGVLTFNYIGKSGQEQTKEIEDDRLAGIVQELDEMPGYRIFKYLDTNGEKHEIECHDLNEYIHEVMGEDFTAKDFRTWAGTMVAAIALDQFDAVGTEDQKQLDSNIKEAINLVAETLGNTPAVARSSYVDPRVIEHYMNGQTVRYFAKQAKKLLNDGNHLMEKERLVLCMLKNSA